MKSKTKFFAEKTKSSLKHLGFTALIISLSVMFSSLCIMSLISLADSLYEAMDGDFRGQIGADVKVYTDSFENTKNVVLEMEDEGTVENYSYLATISQQYVIYFADTYGQEYVSVLGYMNSSYPLEDVMNFTSGNKNMDELLENENGIVISEKLAERNDIEIGDTITLVSSDFFNKETFEVVDLITEDYAGGIYSVFVNENRLGEFEDIGEYIFYIDGDQEKIYEKITDENSEESLYTYIQTLDDFTESQLEMDKSMILFLRGLSILGLFIGSFGIASAIKVIINKRKRELGILKVIGFVEKDITKMLLMEVSAISVIGSIVGVVFGYIFFYYLVNILSSTDNLSIVIGSNFNIIASLISLVVSIVSSILFAYLSIKQVSKIKPVYALKDIDYVQTRKEKGKNILRFLSIGLIFCGISIFLAQSVIYGIGAVALVSVVILIFSLIFKLIYSLILKIPVKTHNEFELSWISLRLNYRKIIVSMIAIFIGIATVNLINTLVYSMEAVYSDQYTEVEADINVITDRANPVDSEIEELIEESDGINSYTVLYKTNAEYDNEYMYGDIVGVDLSKMTGFFNIVEGEQSDFGIVISQDEYVLAGYEIGDIIKVNGIELPITGVYEIDYSAMSSIAFLSGVNFVSIEEFKSDFSDNFIEEVWISVKKENINSLLTNISNIPDIFITSSAQYEDMLNSSINLLIQFSTSIASLALVAGIILIITVTVLDVVSRRRDFAIYKVIGFKQKEVSSMVLLEYGLMTFITSVFASLVVYLFTVVMNEYGDELFDITQKVYFDLEGSILWNLGLMVLVLSLVYLVSRETIKVKPNEVLRYE